MAGEPEEALTMRYLYLPHARRLLTGPPSEDAPWAEAGRSAGPELKLENVISQHVSFQHPLLKGGTPVAAAPAPQRPPLAPPASAPRESRLTRLQMQNAGYRVSARYGDD